MIDFVAFAAPGQATVSLAWPAGANCGTCHCQTTLPLCTCVGGMFDCLSPFAKRTLSLQVKLWDLTLIATILPCSARPGAVIRSGVALAASEPAAAPLATRASSSARAGLGTKRHITIRIARASARADHPIGGAATSTVPTAS